MSSRAVVTIYGPQERDQVARWARNVEPGTVVEFRKKSRSTEQNAKLWAMLGEVSEQVEWYGAKLDPEDWKDMFTASLRHARVVPGIDKGTFVPLGMRTSQMTIAEMTDLIELIHAFGADPAHLVTFKDSEQPSPPAAGTDDALTHAESTAEDRSPHDLSMEPAGQTTQPAGSPSDYQYWLLNVARMLWAATNPGGHPDDLKNQKAATREAFPKPDGCPEKISEKAEAVYRRCKEVVDLSIEREDALALIAGIVGVDQDDILRKAGS